ncbi:MAG: hypothetical protein ACREAM_21110 [Blastocatellia bacterium]
MPAIGVLIILLALPTNLLAQTHVMGQADIHKELVNAARTRQKNLQKARQIFSSDATRKAMESAQINPSQVSAAVSTLSDAELARLASRADKLDQDFAAGRLSDRDLLFIVLGVAALILIIVAVR